PAPGPPPHRSPAPPREPPCRSVHICWRGPVGDGGLEPAERAGGPARPHPLRAVRDASERAGTSSSRVASPTRLEAAILAAGAVGHAHACGIHRDSLLRRCGWVADPPHQLLARHWLSGAVNK